MSINELQKRRIKNSQIFEGVKAGIPRSGSLRRGCFNKPPDELIRLHEVRLLSVEEVLKIMGLGPNGEKIERIPYSQIPPNTKKPIEMSENEYEAWKNEQNIF